MWTDRHPGNKSIIIHVLGTKKELPSVQSPIFVCKFQWQDENNLVTSPSKLYLCVFLFFFRQNGCPPLPVPLLQASGNRHMDIFHFIGPQKPIWRQIRKYRIITHFLSFLSLTLDVPLVYKARDISWYGGMLNVVQIVFAPAAHILKLERYRED